MIIPKSILYETRNWGICVKHQPQEEAPKPLLRDPYEVMREMNPAGRDGLE